MAQCVSSALEAGLAKYAVLVYADTPLKPAVGAGAAYAARGVWDGSPTGTTPRTPRRLRLPGAVAVFTSAGFGCAAGRSQRARGPHADAPAPAMHRSSSPRSRGR